MAPPIFKDLGKATNDLLSKDFPSTFEVKTDTTTAEGLNLNTKLVRGSGSDFSGEFNPKYNLASRGVKLSATVTTSKSLEVEVSKTDAVIAGLKATLKGKAPAFDAPGKEVLTLSTEYKSDRVAITSSLDVVAPKTPLGGLSFVVPYDNVLLGVDVAYALGSSPDLKKVNATVGYTGTGVNFTGFRNWSSAGAVYGATFYHKTGSRARDANIGAEIKHTPGSGRQPDLQIGAAFPLDSGDAKVKLGTNGRIGLGYATRVNMWSTLKLGLNVNAADTRDHTLGMSLSVHD
jgi:voltage-dependent anion channel protein 2